MKVTMITNTDKTRILKHTKSQIRYSLKHDFEHALKIFEEEESRTSSLIFLENAHANMYWYVSGISRTLLAMPNVTIEDKNEIEKTLRKEVERLYRRYNSMLWDVELPRIDINNY